MSGYEELEADLRDEWRRHPAAGPFRDSLRTEAARTERSIIDALDGNTDITNLRFMRGFLGGLQLALRIFDKE